MVKRMSTSLAALLSAIAVTGALAVACENPTAGTSAATVKAGVWGATGVKLHVTASGGKIEYDCGRGTLDQALTMDRDGRFSVTGRHFVEGGPVRLDDPGQPARYDGIVKGNDMSLNVALTDAKRTLGPFALEFGREPVLRKCL